MGQTIGKNIFPREQSRQFATLIQMIGAAEQNPGRYILAEEIEIADQHLREDVSRLRRRGWKIQGAQIPGSRRIGYRITSYKTALRQLESKYRTDSKKEIAAANRSKNTRSRSVKTTSR